jgi:protein farnesyltransferase subunit beta
MRYILSCCQNETGGLRDKPSKYANEDLVYHKIQANLHRHPDTYHTCYGLAGLSAAQHRCKISGEVGQVVDPVAYGFAWAPAESHHTAGSVGVQNVEEEDMVKPIHPVYVIPFEAVEETRAWFYSIEGF